MSLEDEYAQAEELRWQGRFIAAKTRGRWEYVSRTRNIRAAVILATDDGHVILVEQFRVPLGRRTIELPAGLVGEETGYRAGQIETLGEFYSSPGMVTEAFTLFHATALEKVGAGGGVGDEDITVHRVALTEIDAFLAAKRGEGFGIDTRMLLFLGPRLISV